MWLQAENNTISLSDLPAVNLTALTGGEDRDQEGKAGAGPLRQLCFMSKHAYVWVKRIIGPLSESSGLA